MPLYRRPGSPYWWVGIGRKTRRSTGTADRAKAEEFEEVLSERLWRINKLGDRGAASWNEATQRWLADSRRPRSRDRWFIDWLKDDIGEHAVSAVADPDVIEELRQLGLAEGWAHSTVDRMMRTVRAVLRKCKEWRYIESVPTVPMYGEVDAEPRFLTPTQFAKLRAELPPHLERAARFAVFTLLRMRSQSRLTWDRIDMEKAIGWIPASQIKTGKTFGFPLSPDALKVLQECRKADPKGLAVFRYEGKPVDNFHTKAFTKAAERAGVPWLRWHDLRHTGASWAVQNGVTLQELMTLGGWKSYRSVLIYAHLAPSNSASAAKKVAQMSHIGSPKRKRRSA